MNDSRRNFMKTVGLGAAAAGLMGYTQSAPQVAWARPAGDPAVCKPGGAYTWFTSQLETCCPGEELKADEMRITFLGTSCVPRLSQQGVSVYVEVGPSHKASDGTWVPADYAMFDCGMGVLANYIAMGIPYSRMDKIFLAHLHADHMSELSAIYCFGESSDRKSPLYIWGPSASQLIDPVSGEQYTYQDGTKNILEHFREVWRWHTESFSFGYNSYKSFKAPTQSDWNTPCPLEPVVSKYVKYQDPYFYDADGNARFDAYALVPIELQYDTVGGVAYDNPKTGLRITHFPAIHTRRGAISYKVEFRPPGSHVPPITMIYSGDTRPNTTMLDQAKNIDVLAHELVMPPDQWAAHLLGVPVSLVPPGVLDDTTTVVNSSHTTEGALGYMLSQWMAEGTLPRLTAATHFQAQDDTVDLAIQNFAAYGIPRERYTFAADFMVLNVTTDKNVPIRQRRADVSHYAFAGQGAESIAAEDCNVPKYHTDEGASDPYAQIDDRTWIPWSNYKDNGQITYKETGYSDSTLTPKVYMPSVKSESAQPTNSR